MRKCLFLISAVALASLQCVQAAETIYVGGSGGSTEALFKEKIIPSFEAKTGAKVVYVVEGAPQSKLGQQFLQHVVSAESQGQLAIAVGWGPVNKGTKLTPEIAKKVVFGPDKVNALISPNYDIINSKRAEWTNRWNRAVEK